MRILIAPNSFKDCLPAPAVAEAMARGIRSAFPDLTVVCLPMADGGDGLIDALVAGKGGYREETEVPDPLGRIVRARWLRLDGMAVIEMARASGLNLLRPEEYAPLRASSRGVGFLIKAALDSGCRHIVLGLGGSATIDGGGGMLAELGYKLLDQQNEPIKPGGIGLLDLAQINSDTADTRLNKTLFQALTDVRNPLTGMQGAARIFAPQKGAKEKEVVLLEQALEKWAEMLKQAFGINPSQTPGAGAAGGMGAACQIVLRAELIPGAKWVAEQCGFDRALMQADLVLTGEGRLDDQTAFGKAPAFVARRARAAGKPVVALGGMVAPGLDLSSVGICACRPIAPPGVSREESISRAEFFLAQGAVDAVRWAFKRGLI